MPKMITTDARNQLRMSPPKMNSDTTVWRAVSFELGIPYVFFTYSLGQDSSGIVNTLVLWTEEDVLAFCKSFLTKGPKKIFDVSLLLLNYRSDKPHREMVCLREIWSLEVPDSEERYPVYIALNGQRVGQVREDHDGHTEVDSKLLYRLNGMDGSENSESP